MDRSNYRILRNLQHSTIIQPKDLEWSWDHLEATTDVIIADDSFNIIVHPNSSRGTGAVRGNIPFIPGQIYYWEIEVNGSHTATDMIVGVGTKDFNLKSSEDKYCSLIGSDNKSWGYSYTGVKQHDGKRKAYGLRFDKEKTLIGVRLDMWRGTLEFFHNRNPLGVAYEKLNKENLLYPMVCSTACRTQFTVKYCRSLPVNLQLLCLQVLDSSTDSIMPPGLFKEIVDSWWIPKLFHEN
ncbi:SPRY domain-containing SOCS box protein 3-like [Daktulosphaira vitifoliae]|uniref:SPRY domain-containing SOCS box protein 3-like n=1 Tax=Daktulosphaira vitifoliae TaxID=58002 RepID=UPI0021AA430B|nr:SPRY domain-containing SOCS box protein 3-like [Daktulosphaira vitifoliae]